MKMPKNEIEKKRKEMIVAINKEGLSSNTVVLLSQDLDVLIYKYQQKMLQRKTKRVVQS